MSTENRLYEAVPVTAKLLVELDPEDLLYWINVNGDALTDRVGNVTFNPQQYKFWLRPLSTPSEEEKAKAAQYVKDYFNERYKNQIAMGYAQGAMDRIEFMIDDVVERSEVVDDLKKIIKLLSGHESNATTKGG